MLRSRSNRRRWGQGETILVVEDDATLRLILADVLNELGYEVLLAPDARPAIPIPQSDRRIDVMMSDVMLPHINGRKLAENCTRLPARPKSAFRNGLCGERRGPRRLPRFQNGHTDQTLRPRCPGAKVRAMIER